MRLFICDDNVSYRGLIRFVLERDHQIVGEAGDGREAIATVASSAPEVVLLDLNMPGLDGLSSIAGLRSAVPEARIVVLTSGREEDERSRVMEAGADAFIVKPESIFALPEALVDALAGAGPVGGSNPPVSAEPPAG